MAKAGENDNIEDRDGKEVLVLDVATAEVDDEGNKNGKDDCYCGCEQEPQGKKARFMPGHDQRTLGMLVRAQTNGRGVIFTPFDEDKILSPIEAAKHIFSDKMVEKATDRLTQAPKPKDEPKAEPATADA